MNTQSQHERYCLRTGAEAADRLRLLDEIFGSHTRALLIDLGLTSDWRVADVGCGTGSTALWMAQRVGPTGSVVAVDDSADQLRFAEETARSARIPNISFRRASAYETGLPREDFDLTYCRFLLCHLANPRNALREMATLLRPGGLLVCEDYDAGSIKTEPPTHAYRRLVEIIRALDDKRGVDSEIGPKLQHLFAEAGLNAAEGTSKEIVTVDRGSKRFWEITLREAAPAIIDAGVATAEELESTCGEMLDIAEDSKTRLVLTRVWQVWARKL